MSPLAFGLGSNRAFGIARKLRLGPELNRYLVLLGNVGIGSSSVPTSVSSVNIAGSSITPPRWTVISGLTGTLRINLNGGTVDALTSFVNNAVSGDRISGNDYWRIDYVEITLTSSFTQVSSGIWEATSTTNYDPGARSGFNYFDIREDSSVTTRDPLTLYFPYTGLITTLTWEDQSGNGFVGIVNDATHNASGGYWEFNNINDYIDVNYPDNLIASGFSVEFWFNGYATSSQASQFIATQGRMGAGAGDNDSTWRIERNNSQNGTIEFNVNNGAGFNQNELISTNFPNVTWHHCVCIFNNGSSFIYKNGLLDVSSGSYTGTPTHPHNDEIIRIGARYDNSTLAFNGKIGEVRIYPTALTAAQVLESYNATRQRYIGLI